MTPPGREYLGGKGSLRPAQETSQQLGSLVRVVVDRLLSSKNDFRLLFVDELLKPAKREDDESTKQWGR